MEENYNAEDTPKIKLLEKTLSILDKNIKILDVGCGKGHYLKHIISLGFENSFGVEVSDECSKRYLQGVPHEVSDFVSFAKAKESLSYDFILCTDVLEHIDPEEIDEFLLHLTRLSNHAFLGIANHSDIHQGIQLHLIREPWPWWENKLKELYREVSHISTMHNGAFFMCECKK